MRKGVVFVYLGWIGGHIIIFVIRGGGTVYRFCFEGGTFSFSIFFISTPFLSNL